jgi:hypothetical protein
VKVSRGQPQAWLHFYGHFLEVYDNAGRKKTASYYTPPEVVEAMVRLVDAALRDPGLFNRRGGLAARDVTVADPDVATGTVLLGVLRRIAATIEADMGPGAVPPAVEAESSRLIRFEMQFGPFAVAQLRLLAEIQSLMGQGYGQGSNLPDAFRPVGHTDSDGSRGNPGAICFCGGIALPKRSPRFPSQKQLPCRALRPI